MDGRLMKGHKEKVGLDFLPAVCDGRPQGSVLRSCWVRGGVWLLKRNPPPLTPVKG